MVGFVWHCEGESSIKHLHIYYILVCIIRMVVHTTLRVVVVNRQPFEFAA